MEEEKNETADSTNDTESETATEETTEDTESTEESDEGTEDVSKLKETNKKLYERAKKAEAEAKALKAQKSVKADEKPADSNTDFDPLVETVLAVKGLEPDEISELGSEARSLGVKPVKYIQSTAGKAHLAQIRSAKKSKEAAPEIDGHSKVFKKYSEADLSKMSVADMEKILPRSENSY